MLHFSHFGTCFQQKTHTHLQQKPFFHKNLRLKEIILYLCTNLKPRIVNKKSIFIICLLMLSFISISAVAQDYKKQRPQKEWRLVWKDEFKGKRLDPKSWKRCEAGGADWMRHMSPLDSLCKVKNGVLELWGVVTPEGLNESRPYITGGVYSEGLRSAKNGRFEIRARFDCAQGFWPAIWLMPDVKTP